MILLPEGEGGLRSRSDEGLRRRAAHTVTPHPPSASRRAPPSPVGRGLPTSSRSGSSASADGP
ncbi:MAG: hypothetical protein K9G59_05340 [Caulobacter sp.]|nr:hypothetical protein [Caulobacter sp.]